MRDLTDDIDAGRFVGAGTFGHILKGRWKDSNGRLAREIPSIALKVIRLPALKGEELRAERTKVCVRLRFGNIVCSGSI